MNNDNVGIISCPNCKETIVLGKDCPICGRKPNETPAEQKERQGKEKSMNERIIEVWTEEQFRSALSADCDIVRIMSALNLTGESMTTDKRIELPSCLQKELIKRVLKPCPHCGYEAELQDHRTIWSVNCLNDECEAVILGERSCDPDGSEPDEYWERIKQTAVERWNRRIKE